MFQNRTKWNAMKPYYESERGKLYHGDCLEIAPQLDGVFDLCLTDPPFSFAGSSSNGVTALADEQFFEFWFKSVAKMIIQKMKILDTCLCGVIGGL